MIHEQAPLDNIEYPPEEMVQPANQPMGTHPLPAAELDRIASVIQTGPYNGYPAPENRLKLGAVGLGLTGSALIVPDGLWYVSNHVNRTGKTPSLLDPEVPSTGLDKVDPALSERWSSKGLLLDQYGRPVHPDWNALLADDRIGLPTGLGFFFRYGPNATVDSAVYRTNPGDNPTELLLIQRKIGELWALPGGFTDRSDSDAEAVARRETAEEAHLLEIGGVSEVILNKRPVGLRDTLHAWTENTVVLIHGEQDYLHDVQPVPGDDAIDANWFTREQALQLPIFDAHSQYIDLAFRHLDANNTMAS